MALTVMTVDDSPTMRDMVSYTLKEAGYNVLEAEDGVQALSVLGQSKADIVITDLNMPNMDGLTLIKSLRSNPSYKATPILMLTTEADDAKKNAGREAGATGWIVKPFNPEKLLSVLKRIAGNG
ncbi:MAG: response regulator [Micavibrio sp.]|nr:response regulator [Micavibrio sp.]|tara:strand:- start:1921 stop:2292 length:372 start_codon:yes stop_codon:yes gene_type:complete